MKLKYLLFIFFVIVNRIYCPNAIQSSIKVKDEEILYSLQEYTDTDFTEPIICESYIQKPMCISRRNRFFCNYLHLWNQIHKESTRNKWFKVHKQVWHKPGLIDPDKPSQLSMSCEAKSTEILIFRWNKLFLVSLPYTWGKFSKLNKRFNFTTLIWKQLAKLLPEEVLKNQVSHSSGRIALENQRRTNMSSNEAKGEIDTNINYNPDPVADFNLGLVPQHDFSLPWQRPLNADAIKNAIQHYNAVQRRLQMIRWYDCYIQQEIHTDIVLQEPMNVSTDQRKPENPELTKEIFSDETYISDTPDSLSHNIISASNLPIYQGVQTIYEDHEHEPIVWIVSINGLNKKQSIKQIDEAWYYQVHVKPQICFPIDVFDKNDKNVLRIYNLSALIDYMKDRKYTFFSHTEQQNVSILFNNNSLLHIVLINSDNWESNYKRFMESLYQENLIISSQEKCYSNLLKLCSIEHNQILNPLQALLIHNSPSTEVTAPPFMLRKVVDKDYPKIGIMRRIRRDELGAGISGGFLNHHPMSYTNDIKAKLNDSLLHFKDPKNWIIWAIYNKQDKQDDLDSILCNKYDSKCLVDFIDNYGFIFKHSHRASRANKGSLNIPLPIKKLIRYNSLGDLEKIYNIQDREGLYVYLDKDSKLLFERLIWARENASDPENVSELISLIKQQAIAANLLKIL